MIQVTELTRRFSGVTAVDGVTFTVDKGEVVGFLGPNGAGKTTTLRMLTCFLPPTAGTAQIAGFDIHKDPLAVRRNLGYLPEAVPLYMDMRVDEYLRFRARIKGVARADIPGRLREVSEQCRIGEVRNRIVGHLSKGFRQRVGMADALVHDPPILFFDEPTSGLDPNQIREVRDLIGVLSREKTLLISTHILPEVEATCERVIIINKGRIVTDGPIDDIREGGEAGARVLCEGSGASPAEMEAALAALPGVTGVDRGEGEPGRFELAVDDSAAVREAVYGLFREKGWVLRELAPRRERLEEVFWRLTGFTATHPAGSPREEAAG